MAKKMEMGGMTCGCGPANFLQMLFGCLVIAVGVWLFIGGLVPMWNMPLKFDLWALIWMTLGLFVICFGKCVKMKSMCSSCMSMMK